MVGGDGRCSGRLCATTAVSGADVTVTKAGAVLTDSMGLLSTEDSLSARANQSQTCFDI